MRDNNIKDVIKIATKDATGRVTYDVTWLAIGDATGRVTYDATREATWEATLKATLNTTMEATLRVVNWGTTRNGARLEQIFNTSKRRT